MPTTFTINGEVGPNGDLMARTRFERDCAELAERLDRDAADLADEMSRIDREAKAGPLFTGGI